MSESIRRSGAYEGPRGDRRSPVNPGWPIPPAYAPAPPAAPAHASGKRSRGPLALPAAVATASAAVGGGTAFALQEPTGQETVATGSTGTDVVPVGRQGGIAAIAEAVGDQVVAIGSPEGLTGTVTSGIVSALDRDVTVPTDENQGRGDGRWPFESGGRRFNDDTGSSTTTYEAIQTDASLDPDNSGGALIDAGGNVIGVDSAMYSAVPGPDSSGAGSVGPGFAAPINTVKSDLATLRSGSQSRAAAKPTARSTT